MFVVEGGGDGALATEGTVREKECGRVTLQVDILGTKTVAFLWVDLT